MRKIIYLIQCPPNWVKTPPLGLAHLKSYLEKDNVKLNTHFNKGNGITQHSLPLSEIRHTPSARSSISVTIIDLNIIAYKLLSAGQRMWLSLDKTFEENLFSIVSSRYPYIINNTIKKVKDASIVGFSLSKRNKTFSMKLSRMIREKYPRIPMVFGGPQTLSMSIHKENMPEEFKWVIGEGEIPLYKIARGDKANTYQFDEIEDLDSIPFLDYLSLNINLYSRALPVLSSRGCPHQCNFCSERLLYKKLRQHSPEYTVELISFLKNKYQRDTFIFCDSLINSRRKWLDDFCALLIKNNLNIKWEAQMRVDKNFTLSEAELLKRSGCYNLFIGFENASDKVLKAMDKGFSSAEALKFFNTLNKAGLHFEISLIFGYPRESEEDFRENIQFIVRNKKVITKIAQVNPFVDYLGTFSDRDFPTEEAKARIKRFIKVLKDNKIRYTKSFINNLPYR